MEIKFHLLAHAVISHTRKFLLACAKGVAKLHTDGTGLGFYVAREIVKAHHGKAWVESEGEGKGSQFYVLLPLKNSKTEEVEQFIGGM